jgi:hypothetical protein
MYMFLEPGFEDESVLDPPPLPKVESTIKKDTATGNDTKPTATKREPDSIGSVPKRQKTESEK